MCPFCLKYSVTFNGNPIILKNSVVIFQLNLSWHAGKIQTRIQNSWHPHSIENVIAI